MRLILHRHWPDSSNPAECEVGLLQRQKPADPQPHPATWEVEAGNQIPAWATGQDSVSKMSK